jgi:hypothetical protein
MVLNAAGCPATCFITIAARLKDLVSAAATIIRSTSTGVNSRASNPSVTRFGKKRPPTLGAVGDDLLQFELAIDRVDRPTTQAAITVTLASGTRMLTQLVSGDFVHLPLLNLA